ncbi:Eco57I restriction-modification methylase domain-containing protein [Nonomuraea sp. NPDC049400]|uniref:Eco57I restriction-modification methylase domain-containing protein n=1 Tax=Nonomuraea sp. NPDC049400 TaxID=3364352 RepID=UPI0037A8711E
MHNAALVRHAHGKGLIAASGDLRRDVEQISHLHPGLAALRDPAVNPVWDGLAVDPAALADFIPPGSADDDPHRPDGYRLGDLYQQLSTEARKGRALCQTPRYVTSLLLDISFDHAYEDWGPHIRAIDPACGTGHILIETLIRATVRQQLEFGRAGRPALPLFTAAADRVVAALGVVHGVDIDPYAVLLARYRLLVMAQAIIASHTGVLPDRDLLADLPLQVAVADALLDEAEPLLQRGSYHVVVANTPYITVSDSRLNAAIRRRYPAVCHGNYSLALPFHQLFMELLVDGGWCAQLTANSFMKREFGKRYVEQWLPQFDPRWIIDTSGAYIEGHGTPTVILCHRNQAPVSDTVRTVMGIRGEPRKPDDPARGLVWQEIAGAVRRREALDCFTTALSAHAAVTGDASSD